MFRSPTGIFADLDLLLDIVALAVSSMPFFVVVVVLSSFPEPMGYVAVLFAGVAVLMFGQFTYGLLHRRSLVHRFIARVSLLFCLAVIAVFSFHNGDYVPSSLLSAFCLWIGWISYCQFGRSGLFARP